MKVEKLVVQDGLESALVTCGNRRYHANMMHKTGDEEPDLIAKDDLSHAIVGFAIEAQRCGIDLSEENLKNVSIKITPIENEKPHYVCFDAYIGGKQYSAFGEYKSRENYIIEHAPDTVSFMAVWLALELYARGKAKRIK